MIRCFSLVVLLFYNRLKTLQLVGFIADGYKPGS